MADSILYRFPNEITPIHSFGKFRRLLTGEIPNGFVLTNFLHDAIYCFEESETSEQIFYTRNEEPVCISSRDYLIEAQAMLNGFSLMGVDKAVYSRVKKKQFSINASKSLFDSLCAAYPNAFVYLLSSEELGTWIGASPETLIAGTQKSITSVALAGTKAAEEKRDWSEKEWKEHLFVADAIKEALHSNQFVVEQEEDTQTVINGPVQHLKTVFHAYSKGGKSPWELAMDLHPTPAVAGTPRQNAVDLLLSREMHQRELYTGIIGWYSEKRVSLYVNLRCAQLQQQAAFLYVGGGYTIDSIPEQEWEETEKKALTLLRWMNP